MSLVLSAVCVLMGAVCVLIAYLVLSGAIYPFPAYLSLHPRLCRSGRTERWPPQRLLHSAVSGWIEMKRME